MLNKHVFKEMDPLVSIIIPVYNASKYVEQSVYSVINQTYRNIEVIAVDDGSTDNSYELLKSIKDSRLKVFKQLNQGACVARNRGIQESTGEYVKFLDADDYLYPDAIERQVEQSSDLAKNEEVFGDFDFVDKDGAVFCHNTVENLDMLENNQDYWVYTYWDIHTSTPLHRRENIVAVGGFDIYLSNCQETHLHLKLSLSGIRFVYHPCIVSAYRSYESPDRITYKRVNGIPSLGEKVNAMETVLSKVQQKYGKEANRFTTLLSQRYFTLADVYFQAGMIPEGRYCLDHSQSIPHLEKHPRYRGSSHLAKMYTTMGRIIGYRSTTHVMNSFSKMLGLEKREGKKSALLFGDTRN